MLQGTLKHRPLGLSRKRQCHESSNRTLGFRGFARGGLAHELVFPQWGAGDDEPAQRVRGPCGGAHGLSRPTSSGVGMALGVVDLQSHLGAPLLQCKEGSAHRLRFALQHDSIVNTDP